MMTVAQVAAELDLSVRVVYRMLERDGKAMGAIRVGENGGSWRVVRVMFERWMHENNERQGWRESSDDEGQTGIGSRSGTAGSQTRSPGARVASRRSARTGQPLRSEPTISSEKPLIPIRRRKRKPRSEMPSTS
jgi:hypothetical protein